MKNFEALKTKVITDEKWSVDAKLKFKDLKRKLKEMQTRNTTLEEMMEAHYPDLEEAPLFQDVASLGDSDSNDDCIDDKHTASKRKVNPN